MDEQFLNKVVPVKAIKIEKVSFREGGMYLADAGENRKKYSYNVLFANELDPADGVHRFPLMPENPTFILIDDALSKAGVTLDDIPAEQHLEMLPKNLLEGMFGAWVNVDLSKRPVCRLYTTNVVKLVNGQPQIIHKAGDPMKKKGPNNTELDEFAVITQMPVWGFLRKNLEGNYFWLKGYDPTTRLDREINQGRMTYFDLLSTEVHDDKGLDVEPEGGAAEHKLDDAPGLDQIQVG